MDYKRSEHDLYSFPPLIHRTFNAAFHVLLVLLAGIRRYFTTLLVTRAFLPNNRIYGTEGEVVNFSLLIHDPLVSLTKFFGFCT